MKNLLIALIVVLGISSWLSAQNPVSPYLIQLPGGNRVLPANFEALQQGEIPLFSAVEQSAGVAYRLLQFTRIPDQQEKALLAELGIDLELYVRNYAWLVELRSNVSLGDLANFPIRGMYPLEGNNKLSGPLRRGDHPGHALSGTDWVQLWAFPYPRVAAALAGVPRSGANISEQLQAKVASLGGALQTVPVARKGNSPLAYLIEIPVDQVSALAQLPEFYYFEHKPSPPQPDREPSRHTARSNILLTDYLGGLQFDGTGIVTGVAEGRLDSTEIDFKGRITSSYHPGASTSGHAFGVSQRICGAGNKNPLHRGMAPGTHHLTLTSAAWDQQNLYFTENLRVVNHSYGYSCMNEYTSASVTVDNQIGNQIAMMHVISAGNSGTDSSCLVYGVPGWGNITGGHKQAKNSIATASVNDYDVRRNFSSKGPAYDGRIKPDMSATGPGGTSHAAPCVAGVMAQLYQAHRQLNNGQDPHSGLIKGILQNTADDLGNPGPDFLYGYGRINTRRAYEALANNTYTTAFIGDGDSTTVPLTVPAGTKQLRVMLY